MLTFAVIDASLIKSGTLFWKNGADITKSDKQKPYEKIIVVGVDVLRSGIVIVGTAYEVER